MTVNVELTYVEGNVLVGAVQSHCLPWSLRWCHRIPRVVWLWPGETWTIPVLVVAAHAACNAVSLQGYVVPMGCLYRRMSKHNILTEAHIMQYALVN